MGREWFYKLMGESRGPVSAAELRRLAASGVIDDGTPVRQGSAGEWVPARRVKGLSFASSSAQSAAPAGHPPPLPPELPHAPETSDPSAAAWRWPAALIGLSALAAVLMVLVAAGAALHARRRPTPARPPQAETAQADTKPTASRAVEPEESPREVSLEQEPSPIPPTPLHEAAHAGAAGEVPDLPQEAPELDQAIPATRELVKRVEPAVVFLKTSWRDPPGGGAAGSGFIVDERGTIITNYHVIEGAASVIVTFSDGTSSAADGFALVIPSKDLAFLRCERAASYGHVLRLATELPAKGDPVLAFGSPQGLQASVTQGIVSAVRKFRELGIDRDRDPDSIWVQTDAAISGGNSGGPLVNRAGEVVGVNTLKSGSNVQNLNFALAATEVALHLARVQPVACRPFAELPAPPPEQIVERQPQRPPPQPPISKETLDRERDRLSLLETVQQERLVALAQAESIKLRGQDLTTKLGVAGSEYARLYAEARSVSQQGAMLEREAAGVRSQLAWSQDPVERAGLQNRLDLLAIQHRSCIDRYNALDAQALQAKIIGSNLQSQLDSLQYEALQLQKKADELERQWLDLMDALGKLSRGELERAITTFTEWILLNHTNGHAYVCRGFAHELVGNHTAAQTDYSRAAQLDKRFTHVIGRLREQHRRANR